MVWGLLMTQSAQWFAFVLMPFDNAFLPIYTDLIAPALEEVGYSVERADTPIGQRNILKELIKKIDQAHLIVADLTTLNANVMYELGIAHALLKPTVLIIQDIEELPFDLKTYNAIPYSTDFDKVAKLKGELRKVGQGLQTGTAFFTNPVSDFAPSVIHLASPRLQPQIEIIAIEPNRTSLEPEVPSTWLDLVGETHEGIEGVSLILHKITEATQTVGQKMSLRTEQLNKLLNSGLPNAPAAAFTIFKATAQDLGDFTSTTEDVLPSFRQTWDKFSNNLEEILKRSTVSTKEDVEALRTFKSQLLDLQNIIIGSTTSIRSFRNSVNNLPDDVSKHLTQARKQTVTTIEHLIEELTTSDSSISRIVNLVDNLLVDSEC